MCTFLVLFRPDRGLVQQIKVTGGGVLQQFPVLDKDAEISHTYARVVGTALHEYANVLKQLKVVFDNFLAIVKVLRWLYYLSISDFPAV